MWYIVKETVQIMLGVIYRLFLVYLFKSNCSVMKHLIGLHGNLTNLYPVKTYLFNATYQLIKFELITSGFIAFTELVAELDSVNNL